MYGLKLQLKFIITSDNHIRLGRVYFHKDLLQPGDHCMGGGFYYANFISNVLELCRESEDFGKPCWSIVNKLIVPTAYKFMRIVYHDEDKCCDINLSDNLEIIYE